MSVLGVRCSNRDITYAILDGKKRKPSLLKMEAISFPKGYSPSQSLYWLFQEIGDLLSQYDITKIVIKRFEGRTRGKTHEDRVEHEAAVMLAGGARGMKAVFKKVNSTIAKDLGQKGRTRYLANLDTSFIPGFSKLPAKRQEALHAAWSELP